MVHTPRPNTDTAEKIKRLLTCESEENAQGGRMTQLKDR
jgi:hypothetical protein